MPNLPLPPPDLLSTDSRPARQRVGLAALLWCATTAAALADDNAAATAAALKVLTAPETASTAPFSLSDLSSPQGTPAASGARSARTTTQVQRGEGLDAVIRRTLPGLPLQNDFLRQAFMRLNPQVYPTPALRPLRPGTTLQVPGPDDLRQMLKERSPMAAALFQTAPEPESDAASAAQSQALTKRRWVRFP